MSYNWVKKERPEQAPIWCSIDFSEDARIEHLNTEAKKRLFGMLLSLGMNEIELGAPAESENDFSFLQALMNAGLIPSHVRIQVRSNPEESCIRKTLQALQGVGRMTIHLCRSRLGDDALLNDRGIGKNEIVRAVALLERLCSEREKNAKDHEPQDICLEVTGEITGYAGVPEAVRLCNDICTQWLKHKTRRLILNFEEGAGGLMAHVFASCLEEIIEKIHVRENVIIGIRPRRVGSALPAILAGANRVEGAFFGEGATDSRVDILSLAAELASGGAAHKLQLSECPGFLSEYENLTHTKITRPGRGDASYLLDISYGIALPGKMREEFETFVRTKAGKGYAGLQPGDILGYFEEIYLHPPAAFEYKDVSFSRKEGQTFATVTTCTEGTEQQTTARGNGLLDAVSNAYMQFFGVRYQLETYEEHSLGTGSEARALSFVSIVCDERTYWGAGINEDISRSSIAALSAAVGRLCTDVHDAGAEARRIDRILNYVKAHYKSVTLDELSGVFFLSKPYLSKYIREKSGLTFGENLKRIRLQKAKSLLKNGNMKIEQVAGAAGYQNVEHFNRMFKKEYGCTPVQYREK